MGDYGIEFRVAMGAAEPDDKQRGLHCTPEISRSGGDE
jgi:hypothetical protein